MKNYGNFINKMPYRHKINFIKHNIRKVSAMNKWSRIKFTPNLPLGANGERVTGSKAHIELSKIAAKEGMVLLKNENNVLPLAAGSKVALFGKGTFDYVKGGGGSGDVTVAYIRSLYEGLKLQKDKISVFEELCDYYRNDIKKQYAAGAVPGMTIEPDVPAELLSKAQAYTDTAIISICRYSGEGWDRKSVIDPNNKALWDYEREMTEKSAELFKDGDFCLSEKEKEMVDTVKAGFKNVIVILNVGGMVDTSWFAYDSMSQETMWTTPMTYMSDTAISRQFRELPRRLYTHLAMDSHTPHLMWRLFLPVL